MKKLLIILPLCFIFIMAGCSGNNKNESSQPNQTVNVEDAENITVYITKTGECYHKDGCTSLRQSKKERKLSKVYKKYRPCSLCNPPTVE